MNVTDYIIDTSKTEEEAMKKIADRAAQAHGKESVDMLLNNPAFSDEEAKAAIIRLSQTKNPTKEDQPLIDVPGLRDISTPSQWYAGLENLGYGPAKIAAHLTTPITEAIRSVPKYIAENVGENTSQTPPIDTTAEFANPIGLPSSHAGAGLLMQDINNMFGIKNQPLAKISSKDYPKAAQFAENLTVPANVAGMVADVGMARAIPTPNLQKVPVISLEAAADYIRSITKDNSLLKDLEKSGKIYDLARMVQNNPEKYLHQFRPNKVYENIMGKINPPEGSRLLGTGELAKISNYQNDLIETIPRGKYSIPTEELQKAAIADLQAKGGLEAGQKASAQKFIESNIPVIQPDPNKLNKIRSVNLAIEKINEIKSNPNLMGNTDALKEISNLEDFVKENFDPTMPTTEHYMDYIRKINEKPVGYSSEIRRLGNKLMEPAIPGEVSTDIGAKNLAGRSMETAARKAQDQAMAFMPPGDEAIYLAQNKKISDLLNLRNLTEGGLAGVGGRSPYIPGSAGGTTGWVGSAAKAWDRYVKPTSQEMLSGIANQAITNGAPLMRYTSAAANVMSEFSQKSQLNNFKIPMNTERAATNSDMVFKKVLNVFGPKEAEMVKNTRSPEELRSVLRFLHQQNPGVFEQTKYNNIDGHIDPAFKQKAINEITGDKKLPAHINADRMELLLHEGKIQP